MKRSYGNNCARCGWFPNGGCSEWNGYATRRMRNDPDFINDFEEIEDDECTENE